MLDRIPAATGRKLSSQSLKNLGVSVGWLQRKHLLMFTVLVVVALALFAIPTEEGSLEAISRNTEVKQRIVEHDMDPNQPIIASTVATQSRSISAIIEPSLRFESSVMERTQADCRWSDNELVLRPPAVRTKGNYVHIVAIRAACVCVLDSQHKTSFLSLKAGDALSVRGVAPWRIYSRNLPDIRLFFQGYHVPVPDAQATQVSLREQ